VSIRGFGRLRESARRLADRFVPRAVALLYHRVNELPSDPQLLCVSRQNFEEHLKVVSQYGQAIPLNALSRMLQNGDRGQRMIVITFDDGYADNLYNAKPLLERYDMPATVFVTAGYVGSKREFWYDELERIFLHKRTLPETLRLKIDQRWYEWQLGSIAHNGEDAELSWREWNVSWNSDPTARHHVYRSLFQILQPLPDGERRKIVENLATWAGMETVHRPTHRTLTPDEVIRLAEEGLVEVGSHTLTHPVLSAIPLASQRQEICDSKARLEETMGRPVTSFAYPFGGRSHYTEATVAAVREAGFQSACSNFAGVIRPATDPFQLPRFLVRDWDGEQFERQLANWLRT
jgi:peptidoglycan/xylan/chitin deacetylase (PgdA/CDA1 family)